MGGGGSRRGKGSSEMWLLGKEQKVSSNNTALYSNPEGNLGEHLSRDDLK